MKIQTHRPLILQAPKSPSPVPPEEPQPPHSTQGNIEGFSSRATYGGALYGLSALAGAALGSGGVLPAAMLGAGMAAITHPRSLKDAALFGLTGACVGAGVSYAASMLSSTPYAWIPVVAFAAAGAGSQALLGLRES
jgi:hypothetical protein